MKKTGLIISLLALLLTACTDDTAVKYYIAYDDIEMYTSPSDTAQLIGTIGGGVGRRKVSQIDSTGQWGVLKGRVKGSVQQGWCRLEDMVYCGSNNPADTQDYYVVAVEKSPLYKHAKVNKKDIYGGLQKGDTVAATETNGKWVHIHHINYSKGGKRKDHYGWIQLSSLARIEPISEEKLENQAIERTIASDGNGTAKQTIHNIYRWAFVAAGIIAALLVILLMVSASRRKKVFNLLLMLPIAGLLVAFGLDMKMMTVIFLPLIPLMAYTLAYPLLYTNNPRRFGYLFAILTILLTGFYSFFVTDVLGDGGFNFWHLLLCIIVLVACCAESHFIYKRIEPDICPHCGYWARHEKGHWGVTDSNTTHSTHTEDRFVRREEHMDYATNTKHITEHYQREKVDVATTTSQHSRTRTCQRCGKQYENTRNSTYSTKSRH